MTLVHSSERRNDDVPTVVVVGPAAKAIRRSRLTSLKMAASPPACGEMVDAVQFIMTTEWLARKIVHMPLFSC